MAEAGSNPIYRFKPTFLSQKWETHGMVFAQRQEPDFTRNSTNHRNEADYLRSIVRQAW
jgi:hypothetical protein